MSEIVLRGIIDEDFVNYRVPSMTLMFPKCSFKCGLDVCQNASLVNTSWIVTDVDKLCERYLNNPITEAVVCQGLEPFDSFYDLLTFVRALRITYDNNDDIVIYTGYSLSDIEAMVNIITEFGNIVIKYGRFIPDSDPRYDDILGVKLASKNQYAVRYE